VAVISMYPGSFDPITNGHLDIIRRCFALSDSVVVAVGAHHQKEALFSREERIQMINLALTEVLPDLIPRIRVVTFDGLAVEIAIKEGAEILVRGLRDGLDLDYEMKMAGTNSILAPDIQTVFLLASAQLRHISSAVARQVAALGGDVSAFVPASIAAVLSDKFSTKV